VNHRLSLAMNIHRDGNLIEAGVWFLIAVVLAVHASRRDPRLRPTLFLLAVGLAVFGITDLVEVQTGAWWRPWWLLIWKASCVVTLLTGLLRYYRLLKMLRSDETPHQPVQGPNAP
jgi:hypothetical protein